MKEIVKIYTDGACSVQSRIGGIGVVMIYKGKSKEISEGYKDTTNSRMELLSVIRALEVMRGNNWNIEIYSDSKYVIDSVEKRWVFNWEKENFKERKNSDLWIKFLELYRLHNIKMIWVKGHASNPINNRCDELAVMAKRSPILLSDR
jgi:ribonuclease HI